MAKRNAERNRKKRERHQRAAARQAACPESATPQSPPEEAAAPSPINESAADPETTEKLAALQRSYDESVERGNACLASGDPDEASEHEASAREALRESKRLTGVDPIAPGAVRKLTRAIGEYADSARRETEQRMSSLRVSASERLRLIKEVSGRKTYTAVKAVTHFGDVHRALELVRMTDPNEADAYPDEFRMLESELSKAVAERDIADAQHQVREILREMGKNPDRAQKLLDGFPAHLLPNADLNGMQERIDEQRVALKKAEEKRARAQEQAEFAQRAYALYLHIMGCRNKPVKPRDSAERLRKAERDQPELLACAAGLSRYGNVENMRGEIEHRRERATQLWQAFQELEYLEKAPSSADAAERLLETFTRGLINVILDREDVSKRIQSILSSHKEAIVCKARELAQASCRECMENACLLLYKLGYGRRDDMYWLEEESELDTLCFDTVERMVKATFNTDCGNHEPKEAPWQKVTKKSRKREENANAQ